MKTHTQWHAKDFQTILKSFDVQSSKGLTQEQVKDQKEKFGENKLSKKEQKSKLLLFLQQFNQPLVYHEMR